MALLCSILCGCDHARETITIATDWDWRSRVKLEKIAKSLDLRIIWSESNQRTTRIRDPQFIGDADLGLIGPWGNRCINIVNFAYGDPVTKNWPEAYANWIIEAGGGSDDNQTMFRSLYAWCAIIPEGKKRDRVPTLLAELEKTCGPRLPIDPTMNSATLSLLSDLIEATTEVAGPELRAAAAMIRTRPDNPVAIRWFHEPPPWPPASINRLNGDESSRDLMSTLAEQIAPDLESRHWLLASWSGPAQPLDLKILREIALAGGGRLASEPRFRAWIRSEWTNWARQRYRRVTRLVARDESP